MTSLQEAHLDGNRVRDLHPLLDLPSLHFVSLRENPLSHRAREEQISHLRLRGVTVRY